MECADLLVGVALQERVDGDEEKMIGIEAEIDVVRAAEGFEEEAADHQEDDGESDLSADEDAACDGTEGAAGGSGRARGHDGAPCVFDGHECGRDAEE